MNQAEVGKLINQLRFKVQPTAWKLKTHDTRHQGIEWFFNIFLLKGRDRTIYTSKTGGGLSPWPFMGGRRVGSSPCWSSRMGGISGLHLEISSLYVLVCLFSNLENYDTLPTT